VGQVITAGQFLEAIKFLACKLYANIIEIQTGTLLECLPPRQREVAARAAIDVMIKKKLLPTAEKLGLIPWPLIYVDHTVNVLSDCRGPAFSCLSRNSQQILKWYLHYKSFSEKSASSGGAGGVMYKHISKFGHDFGVIPYLLREPQLYGLVQEVILWSVSPIRSAGMIIVTYLIKKYNKISRTHTFQIQYIIHTHQPLYIFKDIFKSLPNEVLSLPIIMQEMTAANSLNSVISTKGKSSSSVFSGIDNIGLSSFFLICATIATQVFPDVAPEFRLVSN